MIYPIDVVKTKIQTDSFDPSKAKYSSALDCFKKTWNANGIKGFYRGFGACMLRAGPANAVSLFLYIITLTRVLH
jgi:solute carrier family 25 (mitochondrial carnitine/acylcarnitine transporter), member 20/29